MNEAPPTRDTPVFRTVNPRTSLGESLSILGVVVLMGFGALVFLALKDRGALDFFGHPLAGNIVWFVHASPLNSWWLVYWPIAYMFPNSEPRSAPLKITVAAWGAAWLVPVVTACAVAYALRSYVPAFGVVEAVLLLMLGGIVGRAIGERVWENVSVRELAPWKRAWSVLNVPVSLLLIGWVTWWISLAVADTTHLPIVSLVLYTALVGVGLALNAARTWRR